MSIQTVLGEISPRELGFCHCHEHIFIEKGKSYQINPVLCIDDMERSVEELDSFYQCGGRAIVDAQPVGCGRMADALVKASQQSNVHIVGSTGFHKMIFYPDNHWVRDMTSEEFAQIMIDEIQNGMYVHCDDSYPEEKVQAKAGMIKAACDQQGITPEYERLLKGAAIASIKTGATIQCHTEMGKFGVDITKYLKSCGVKPESIIIAHMDRVTDNVDEHKKIAEEGAFLQYDTIGRYKYHSDEEEVQLIQQMIGFGFEDHILLGLDTTRARLKSYNGDVGLLYIIEKFIPLLQKSGISKENINKFMINNPAKALSIK